MIGFEQIDIDKYLPFSNEWLNFSLILIIALTPVFLSIYFKNKKSSQNVTTKVDDASSMKVLGSQQMFPNLGPEESSKESSYKS